MLREQNLFSLTMRGSLQKIKTERIITIRLSDSINTFANEIILKYIKRKGQNAKYNRRKLRKFFFYDFITRG